MVSVQRFAIGQVNEHTTQDRSVKWHLPTMSGAKPRVLTLELTF